MKEILKNIRIERTQEAIFIDAIYKETHASGKSNESSKNLHVVYSELALDKWIDENLSKYKGVSVYGR